MARRARSHLTYANVAATLALFLTLGGVGYAAVKLPKNSVGARQLQRNAITGANVRNGTLTGTDVKDQSLTASDFRGSVQGPSGPQGPVGPAGPAGPAGSARAYGYVKSDGTLLAARSKNLTVTKLGTGYYCVRPTPASGIDPGSVAPVATPDFSDGGGTEHQVQSYAVLEPQAQCLDGWEFRTNNVGTGATDLGFAVLVP